MRHAKKTRKRKVFAVLTGPSSLWAVASRSARCRGRCYGDDLSNRRGAGQNEQSICRITRVSGKGIDKPEKVKGSACTMMGVCGLSHANLPYHTDAWPKSGSCLPGTKDVRIVIGQRTAGYIYVWIRPWADRNIGAERRRGGHECEQHRGGLRARAHAKSSMSTANTAANDTLG